MAKFQNYERDLDTRAERLQLEAELAYTARKRRGMIVQAGLCKLCETQQARRNFWTFVVGLLIGAIVGGLLSIGFMQVLGIP